MGQRDDQHKEGFGAQLDGVPATIAQTGFEGGPNPSPLTFRIANPGSCPLAYTLTASTSDGGGWLLVSTGWTLQPRAAAAVVTVTLDVVAAALPPGTYTGSLLVTGQCTVNGTPAVRSPRNVSVNLTVVRSGARCPPDFRPIPTTCGVGACASTGQIACQSGVYTNSCVPACVPTGTLANPGTSCAQILRDGHSTGDGLYWLEDPPRLPRRVYCDMTTDGGGWTALFVGKNGSPNVFDHFDDGAYLGTFAAPTAQRFLQRAPATIADRAAEIAVSCGGAMVSFAMTRAVEEWLDRGTQRGWAPLTSRVLAGTVTTVPNTLYTGESASSLGFIFTTDRVAFSPTFASSYGTNDSFDYCNGVFDQTSVTRVYYREVPRTPVKNTPAAARASCRAIVLAGASAGSGIYWLREPGGAPYEAYCDMTTDGGG